MGDFPTTWELAAIVGIPTIVTLAQIIWDRIRGYKCPEEGIY